MDANFKIFSDDLASVKGEVDFPQELLEYDSTRFHYVVVAGRREDFSEKTYRSVRGKKQKLDITFLHHDNLLDQSIRLENPNIGTF